MSFKIEPAVRQGVIPLIGMYGKSGSGKTFSALLLARGMAGPKGRIGIVDTESRRASLFADLIPGGYEVINFEPPFTPERYSECLDVMQQSFDVGIYDSLSHLWDGEEGILDLQERELQRMAGDDFKRREACKMAAWIKPKSRYKAWFQKMLRSKIPLICCLRGQEKTHMAPGRDGKNTVVTDEYSTPIFDGRFIFEMLCNLETVQVDGKPGCAKIRKWSHPDLLRCLPKEGEQISERHGGLIAEWCGGSKPSPQRAPKGATQEKSSLKAELWKRTQSIHGGDLAKLEAWLRDKTLLGETESLKDFQDDHYKWLLEQIKNVL